LSDDRPLTYDFIQRAWEMLCSMTVEERYGIDKPVPVKADSFDEWQRKTGALLEECEKLKR
jgi:hypothetical protein